MLWALKTTNEFAYSPKTKGEVIVTRVDARLNWCPKNSLWPTPMGLVSAGYQGKTVTGLSGCLWMV